MYGCINIILAIFILYFCYMSNKRCNKCKNNEKINYINFLIFIVVFNIIYELLILFIIKNNGIIYRFIFNVTSLFLILLYLLTPILIIKYVTYGRISKSYQGFNSGLSYCCICKAADSN